MGSVLVSTCGILGKVRCETEILGNVIFPFWRNFLHDLVGFFFLGSLQSGNGNRAPGAPIWYLSLLSIIEPVAESGAWWEAFNSSRYSSHGRCLGRSSIHMRDRPNVHSRGYKKWDSQPTPRMLLGLTMPKSDPAYPNSIARIPNFPTCVGPLNIMRINPPLTRVRSSQLFM